MAPQPVVTGLSPKEGPPGTRIIIRGEFLGTKSTDLIGMVNSVVVLFVCFLITRFIKRFKNLWFRLFVIG